MNRFLASLKDKRFRYGSFSTAMILIVVGIFLLVNLVAGQLNVRYDLTQDKMYSLSKYSKEFLAELDQDVTLYALFKTGQEDMMFKQLLEEYATVSPHVSVVYRDPVLYPSFVEQYAKTDEKIADNSVIVVSGDKHKVVHAEDLATYEYDYNTWEQVLTSIDIEPQISNAINYVTSGETTVIYYVKGSNEYDLPANMIKQVEMANYEFRDVDLVTGDIPEDCGLLFITIPGRDWSVDEADRILQYLQNDGRAIFALGYMPEDFPNMNNVLAAYGVSIGKYLVVEGDTRYFYMNNPGMIIPQMVPGEITQNLIDKGFPSLMYAAASVEELPIKKTSTKIEPCLVSSAASYGKINPNSETPNKEPGDLDGPFSFGVAVTDTYYSDVSHTTKMVVLGCEYILEENLNSMIGGTNWDIVVNSINWLQDNSTSIYIPSKSPSSTTQLQMTQSQAGILALTAMVILPLAVAAIGLVVWLRRRHS